MKPIRLRVIKPIHYDVPAQPHPNRSRYKSVEDFGAKGDLKSNAPLPSGRSIFTKFSSEPLLFQGNDKAAPQIRCGNCRAILVRDVIFSSFVWLGRDEDVSPSNALFIPIGNYGISKPIQLGAGQVFVAENGPLVLHCAGCGAHNEVVDLESIN
jgi:hypothetical protein